MKNPAALLAAFALCLVGGRLPVQAAPQGGTVAAGLANIIQSGATTSINQLTDKAIINWNGFSIDVNELVKFLQPGAGSVALNRVTGADASSILGQLTANGRVFLLNPNGILFGPGSKVDVASLAATTFGIKDSDFLAGRYEFLQDAAKDASFVINRGDIKVAKNGFCFLVAPSVSNEGLIIAQVGKVVLGAGNRFTMDFNGDGLIKFDISGKVLKKVTGPDGQPLTSAVSNTGTVRNDGGQVVLTGDAADAVVKSVVNNEGVIEAKSLVNAGGEVKLVGGEEGIVQNKGTLDVSAAEAGAQPGKVSMTGNKVGNFDTILAKGADAADGGTVSLRSTGQTLVTSDAAIDVSGGGDSGAGTIDIWSDTNATVAGTLTARGGEQGGDGGLIEVSSAGGMSLTAQVDTLAPAGEVGSLLLDPKNVTIADGGGADLDEVDEFIDNPSGDATISPATLLGAAAAVTIRANNDIKVNSNLWTLGGFPLGPQGMDERLTLQAGRTVEINADIYMQDENLVITANVLGANPAYRNAGAASIKQKAGTVIDAGSGSVTLTLAPGADGTVGGITVDRVKTTGTLTVSTAGYVKETPGDPALTATNYWGPLVPEDFEPQEELIAGTLNLVVTAPEATFGEPIDEGEKWLEVHADITNTSVQGMLPEDFVGYFVLQDLDGGFPVGAMDAGGGSVILKSVAGSITAATGGGAPNISAWATNLTTDDRTGPDRDWSGDKAHHPGGSVGTSGSPLRTDVVVFSATAYDGGIFVDEVDDVILSSVLAQEDGNTPQIGQNGQVVIWPSGESAYSGNSDLVVTVGGDVVVGTVKSPDRLELYAPSGAIVDNNQVESNLLAQRLTLTARDWIGQAADPLETMVEEITATTVNGGVFLTETDGARVQSVTAGGSGNSVLLTSGSRGLELGSITAAGGTVTVKSNLGTVTDANDPSGGPPAANIVAERAEITSADGVGTSSNPVETTVAHLTAAATNTDAAIHLAETDGLSSLTVRTNSGKVNIQFLGGTLDFNDVNNILSYSGPTFTFSNTGGDLKLGLVDAGTASVVLTATGDILESSSDAADDVVGGAVTLTADKGIGTSANPLETRADSLSLTAKGGNVYVVEEDAVTVTASATGAGNDVQVSSATGDLTVKTAKAPDEVVLNAGGSLLDGNGVLVNVTGATVTLAAGAAIGTASDPFDLQTTTLARATTAAGSLYLDSRGPLTVTEATATGGDLSLTVAGDLTLSGVRADGDRTVSLNCTGSLIDGDAVAVDLTAGTANLIAMQIGESADELETDVGTLSAKTGSGSVFITELNDLTVEEVIAQGLGSHAFLTAGGDMVLKVVKAEGDQVGIRAGGQITDGNGPELNITADLLDIAAPGGVGTDADQLELKVNRLGSADGGASGISMVNDGPMSITDATLEGKPDVVLRVQAASITVLDMTDNEATLGNNGSVLLVTESGNIVFLDPNDTIAASGTGYIGISAGMQDESGAVAIVGNLRTAGGAIEIWADRHISIGLLDTGGTGDVTVASRHGVILDGNGAATNIIGNTVTLQAEVPTEREAALETMFKIADAAAAVSSANDQALTALTLNTATGIMEVQKDNSEEALDKAEADAAAAAAEAEAKGAAADAAEITAETLDGVAQALDTAAAIAEVPAGAAQAIPLSGDGGAMAAFAAIDVAAKAAGWAAYAAGVVADKLGAIAEEAANAEVQANAELTAAKADYADATATYNAFNESYSVAQKSADAAAIARDHAKAVRDQAIDAEDVALNLTSLSLGIQAARLDVDLGLRPDSSFYIDAPGDLGLGTMTATGAGAEFIVTAAGDLSVKGTITSPTWVSLDAGDQILDGGGLIVAPEFLAQAVNGIGLADPAVGSPPATGALQTQVSTFAANGGTGGVFVNNTGALTLTTITDTSGADVVGITAGGNVGMTTTGNLTFQAPISAPGQTVTLNSTTGGLIDQIGDPIDVTAGTLVAHGETGIELDTAIDDLTASTAGAAPMFIHEQDALTLTNLSSATGLLTVLAGGTVTVNTVTTGGNVTLIAASGAVDDDNDNGTFITGDALFMTAPAGIGTTGADATKQLDTLINTLTLVQAIVAGPVNLGEQDGLNLVYVAATNGDVTLTTGSVGAGDLVVGIVAANGVGNTVTLTAAQGSILDSSFGDMNDVVATNLALVASNGIGVALNPLDVTVTNLEAQSGPGGIFVQDLAGGLAIGGVTPGLSLPALTGLLATGGDLVVTAFSPLTINEAVIDTAGGDIVLTAGASAAQDDLTINAEIAASGGNGAVVLTAGDSVIQNANVSAVGFGEVRITATAGSIAMANGTSTTVQNATVTYVAAGDLGLAAITTGATGNVVLNALAGAIVDANAGALNVNTNFLTAYAATGVGTLADPLETTIAMLAAFTTGKGPLAFSETDGVLLSDVIAANGPIWVSAGGTIVAHKVISTTDDEDNDITLTATGGGSVVVDELNAGTAKGDVALSADTGGGTITTSAGGRLTADMLTATAVSGINLTTTLNSADLSVTGPGSLTVRELNALTLTDLDTANGLITVTAGGTITATDVQSLTDNDANDILLTATAGGAIVDLVKAGNGAAADVAIAAAGSIGQAAPADAAVDILADRLTLTAGTGIGAGAGGPLDLRVNSLLVTTTTGDLNLAEADDVTLDNLVSSAGSLSVTSGGTITVQTVTAAQTVTLTAANRIDDDNVNTTLSTAQTLNLTAPNGIGATGANGTRALDTQVATLASATVATAGQLNIAEKDGLSVTQATAANGDVTITSATGDIAIGIVSANAAGNTVTFIAPAGAITDAGAAAAANNVTATNLAMTAATGIGAAGNPLEVTVNNLEASGGSGGVFVTDLADGLIVGGVTPGLGNPALSGLLATGNDLVVAALSPLTINEAVSNTGGGNLTLTAGASAAVDDLTINAPITASGGNGSLTLMAGDSVLQNANVSAAGTGNVAATATAGNVTMAGGTSTTVANGNVTYAAGGNVAANVITTATGGAGGLVALTATGGAITDVNAGAVNVTANNLAASAASGIGAAADPFDTKVASITALTMAAGAIVLNEVDAVTLTNVTAANGPITVTAGGNLAAANVVSTTDDDANDILLTANGGGSITLGQVNAGTGNGDVTLLATTGAGTISTNPGGQVTGDVVTATAVNDVNLTTSANRLIAAAAQPGAVVINELDAATVTSLVAANGPITVTAGGTLTVAGPVISATDADASDVALTTTAGDIALDAAVSAGTAAGDVTLTSAGAISATGGTPSALVAADHLAATAGGLISLITTANTLSAVTTAAGAITVAETNAVRLTNVTAANGPITVTAGGTITADNVVSKTDKDANDLALTATGGGSLVLGTINAGTANGDVTLLANAGSGTITTTNPNGRVTGDVLTATAVRGTDVTTTANSADLSVTGVGALVVRELNAITLTDLDTANGPLTVTAGGTIAATDVRSLTDADANDIVLTATAGGVVVNLMAAGAGAAADVTITATGAITESTPADVATDVTGDRVTLAAGTGIGTGAGGPLDTAAITIVATSAAGNLNLNEANGVVLKNVVATAGNVTITTEALGAGNTLARNVAAQGAGNDVYLRSLLAGTLTVETISAADDVTLIATAGRIDDDNVNATLISGDALVLTAPNGIGGTGANGTRALDTKVTTLTSATAATAGQINVAETNGLTVAQVTAANGDVTLTSTTGNVNVGLVSANTAGNTVTLIAKAGAVTDADGGDANDVSATNLALTAATGIGTAVNPLEVTVNKLEATGGTGGVFVTDLAGGLTVGGVTPGLGNPALTGLLATGNDIIVTALSPLTINEAIADTGGGDITLTAGESAAQADLTVNATVTATGGNGSITLLAGDSLLQNANVSAVGTGNVAATATAGDLTMAAGTSTTVGNGDVTYTAGNSIAVNVISTTTGGAGGNVTLTATTGNVSDVNAEAVNVTANNLTASAATGIGAVADPLDTTVATVNATTTGTGPIVLNETDDVTLTLVNTANGLITVTADGTINATSVVSSTDEDANDLTLTATGGGSIAVGQVDAGSANGDATLTANTGTGAIITSPGGRVAGDLVTGTAQSGIALVTAANSLDLTVTGAGAAVVDELGAVTVWNLTTADGPITVTTGGTLTVAGGITSLTDADANAVKLTTRAGDLALLAAVNAGAAGGDLLLGVAGAISGAGGGPSALGTGDNLVATAGGPINLTTSGNTLEVTTSAAGAITLNETDAATLTNVVAADGPVTVTAGGSLVATNVVSATDRDDNDISLTATGGGSLTLGQVDAGIANGDVTLSANTGGGTIVTTAPAGRITGDVLTATAVNGLDVATTVNSAVLHVTGAGNVSVAELGAITLTEVHTADGSIAVTAGGTLAALEVNSLTDSDANDITLIATTGDVVLKSVAAGTGTAGEVTVSAAGALYQSVQTEPTNPADAVLGDRVVLTAATGLGTGAGGPMLTAANTLAATTAAGDVSLNEANAVTLENVAASGGSIGVMAGGTVIVGTITAADAVTLATSAGAIDDDNVNTTLITANALTLTAPNGLGTAGAEDTRALDTQVVTLTSAVATDAGPINLTEADGLTVVQVSAADGDATFTNATGNLSVGLVSANAPGNTVTLAAATGAIVDADGGGANNVAATNLALTAASGIGTAADPLEVMVDNLEASGGTGGVYVTDLEGGVTLGGVTPILAGVTVTSGNLVITALSPLWVIEAVTNSGGGDIILTAAGSALLDNITVNAPITATGGNGTLTLLAADSVVQNANLSAVGTGGVVVTATLGSLVTASGTSTATQNGNVVYTAGDRLSLGGALAGSGNGSVILKAANSVAQNATLSTAGNGNVSVTATTGSITMGTGSSTVVGTGNILYLAGDSLSINQILTALGGAGGNVTLTALTGTLIDINGAETNVTANNLTANYAKGAPAELNSTDFLEELLGPAGTPPTLILFENRILGGAGIDMLAHGQAPLSWMTTGSAFGSVESTLDDLRDRVSPANLLVPVVYYRVEGATRPE